MGLKRIMQKGRSAASRGHVWAADFRDQTRTRRVRRGPVGESKREAEARLRRYLAEVDAGTYVHPSERASQLSVAEAVAQFLEKYSGRGRAKNSPYYKERSKRVLQHCVFR